MIRTKLTLWNCLVLTLVLTAVGFAIYITTAESLYASIDESLRARAKFMSVDWPMGPGGPGGPGRRMQGGPGDRGDRGGPGDPGDPGNPDHRDPNSRGPGGPNDGPGPVMVQGVTTEEGIGGAIGVGTAPRGGFFRQFDLGMNRDELRKAGIDPRQYEELRAQGEALMPRIMKLNGTGFSPRDVPWNQQSFNDGKLGKTTLENVRVMDQPFRVVTVPLHRNGKIEAVAQFAFPLAGVQKELNRLQGILLIVFPFSIIVMLAAGVVLTRRALQPVTKIADAAEQIEATNLSGRLEVQGSDEFGHLSETFNTMLARLEATFKDKDEAYARLRQFTADASHELKTPLTAIRVRTGLALRRGEIEPEKYRHHLEAIDRAAVLMTSIVQDLLFLAKSDEGRLDLHMDTTPAQEIVDDAVASVDVSKHEITLDVTPNLVVTGDRAALTRVLVNLLENSVRHTPEKGRIFLEATAHKGGARFTVRDEGAGIPAEHVPLVFDRFHRVDMARDRQAGGSGLGLAIAKAIVDAHGGEITLSSELEKGTTVTMQLRDKPAA